MESGWAVYDGLTRWKLAGGSSDLMLPFEPYNRYLEFDEMLDALKVGGQGHFRALDVRGKVYFHPPRARPIDIWKPLKCPSVEAAENYWCSFPGGKMMMPELLERIRKWAERGMITDHQVGVKTRPDSPKYQIQSFRKMEYKIKHLYTVFFYVPPIESEALSLLLTDRRRDGSSPKKLLGQEVQERRRNVLNIEGDRRVLMALDFEAMEGLVQEYFKKTAADKEKEEVILQYLDLLRQRQVGNVPLDGNSDENIKKAREAEMRYQWDSAIEILSKNDEHVEFFHLAVKVPSLNIRRLVVLCLSSTIPPNMPDGQDVPIQWLSYLCTTADASPNTAMDIWGAKRSVLYFALEAYETVRRIIAETTNCVKFEGAPNFPKGQQDQNTEPFVPQGECRSPEGSRSQRGNSRSSPGGRFDEPVLVEESVAQSEEPQGWMGKAILVGWKNLSLLGTSPDGEGGVLSGLPGSRQSPTKATGWTYNRRQLKEKKKKKEEKKKKEKKKKQTRKNANRKTKRRSKKIKRSTVKNKTSGA